MTAGQQRPLEFLLRSNSCFQRWSGKTGTHEIYRIYPWLQFFWVTVIKVDKNDTIGVSLSSTRTSFERDTLPGPPSAIEIRTASSYNPKPWWPKRDVSWWRCEDYRPSDFSWSRSRLCADTVRDLAEYNRTSSSYACEMVLEKCSKGLRNSYFVLQHALQA